MGGRKSGRARRRHSRGEFLPRACPFSLAPTTSKRLLRRLALLKSNRDTGTEKDKTKQKQRKLPYKMMSVLFCLLRGICLLLSNMKTEYYVNDYMMTCCKGLLRTYSKMSPITAATLQSERCMKNWIECNPHITRISYFVFLCHA